MNIFTEEKGFIKSKNGYLKRLDTMLWMEIDPNGFVELRRKSENIKKTNQYSKVTLPKPIRNEKDLNLLLLALIGEEHQESR